MLKLLRGGRLLNQAMEIVPGDLLLENDAILQILAPGETPSRNVEVVVDLEGYVIFPGLVNAHDHLVDSFPYAGPDQGSQSWYEWEAEFKQSTAYLRMQKLSAADLYSLGMYRNLLSGVTLVADHFPREITSTFRSMPQITLLEHYFLAHSVSARRLEWGQGIQAEYSQSRGVLPFILHLAEGFAQDLTEECENLNRLGALKENTVLINCLGLTPAQIEVVATRKAAVVWCPNSCQAIFQAQPPLAPLLDAKVRLVLGSDRALASPEILLQDLREARRIARENLGGRLSDLDLVRMVTCSAAEVLGAGQVCGSIAPGKLANLLVFEDTLQNPLESFFALTTGSIALLVHRGGLVFGDERFRSLCSLENSQYTEVLAEDRHKILMGRPFQLLDRIECKLEETVAFPFLPLSQGK